MTVAHKDLTGTDLHEVKGASTATSGQVPVANGAGGAPFGKLTHTSLQTTGNPFGAQLLHVREEQATGVATTASAVAGFNAQPLNTVKTNEITGASLASNTITLPAGTYWIEAQPCTFWVSVAAGGSASTKSRLRNTSDGTTILVGTVSQFTVGGSAEYGSIPPSIVRGRFTLAGTKNLQLQTYVVNGSSPTAFGGGEIEVYAEVLIWKVA